MSPALLEASLDALRHTGSVTGLFFLRANEILYADTPHSLETAREFAVVLDDIANYFKKENRPTDQAAFGYDGGNLVVVLDGRFRLVVLHGSPEEADAAARAARAFLKDYQMAVFAERFRRGGTAKEAWEEMRSVAARRGGEGASGEAGEAPAGVEAGDAEGRARRDRPRTEAIPLPPS